VFEMDSYRGVPPNVNGTSWQDNRVNGNLLDNLNNLISSGPLRGLYLKERLSELPS